LIGHFDPTENQLELARIGRQMMEFSENYYGLKHVPEQHMNELNQLSSIGDKLTTYGTAWGITAKDLKRPDLELIDDFMHQRLATQKFEGVD